MLYNRRGVLGDAWCAYVQTSLIQTFTFSKSTLCFIPSNPPVWVYFAITTILNYTFNIILYYIILNNEKC